MIQLLLEDDFTLNNNIFEINLPLYMLQMNDIFVTEGWNISPDLLIAPKGADNEYAVKARHTIVELLNNNALPELKQIIDYINNKYDIQYSVVNNYLGDVGIVNNQVSISYYVSIDCDVPEIKCSEKIFNSLSNFRLRIANHISKNERMTINNRNNVKLYTEQVIGLYEQLFIKYTNNIFDKYTQFLFNLTNYNHYIETFADITEYDMDLVKSVAVQGEFTKSGNGIIL